MKTSCRVGLMMSAFAVCGVASGEVVRGRVTADNHYALYSSTDGAFAYHGGNETGASGTEGSYNWSAAECWEFESGEYLYIASWSDDQVAQGVLADFESASLGRILSGDARWEVFGTGVNRGTGDAHPGVVEIASHVALADGDGLWRSVVTGGVNGVEPWGGIAGIEAGAEWMWRDSGAADSFRGSHGAGEMLIFRAMVPAPGALALLGLGGVLAGVRRR
jgi:hypothetical protein